VKRGGRSETEINNEQRVWVFKFEEGKKMEVMGKQQSLQVEVNNFNSMVDSIVDD
jgi:hypothetical protein